MDPNVPRITAAVRSTYLGAPVAPRSTGRIQTLRMANPNASAEPQQAPQQPWSQQNNRQGGWGKQNGWGKSGQSSSGQNQWVQPTWTPDLGVSFEEFVHATWETDPALRFLYNWTNISKPPQQCKRCREHGRKIEYDEATDVTRIVHELCQTCRYACLQVMNLEYKLFNLRDKEESA